MTQNEVSTHVIDATGKSVGRLATQVATLLLGKHKPTFAPHQLCGDKVEVTNAAKLRFDQRKLEGKIYYRHTMYPGGLRQTNLKKMMEKDPTAVVRMAVEKMLPKNRLRAPRLKNLKITV